MPWRSIAVLLRMRLRGEVTTQRGADGLGESPDVRTIEGQLALLRRQKAEIEAAIGELEVLLPVASRARIVRSGRGLRF